MRNAWHYTTLPRSTTVSASSATIRDTTKVSCSLDRKCHTVSLLTLVPGSLTHKAYHRLRIVGIPLMGPEPSGRRISLPSAISLFSDIVSAILIHFMGGPQKLT